VEKMFNRLLMLLMPLLLLGGNASAETLAEGNIIKIKAPNGLYFEVGGVPADGEKSVTATATDPDNNPRAQFEVLRDGGIVGFKSVATGNNIQAANGWMLFAENTNFKDSSHTWERFEVIDRKFLRSTRNGAYVTLPFIKNPQYSYRVRYHNMEGTGDWRDATKGEAAAFVFELVGEEQAEALEVPAALADGNIIAIMAKKNNKFLIVGAGGDFAEESNWLTASFSGKPEENEATQFEVIRFGSNKFALRSVATGNYVQSVPMNAEPLGIVRALNPSIDFWELHQFVDGKHIKQANNDEFGLDNGGSYWTQPHSNADMLRAHGKKQTADGWPIARKEDAAEFEIIVIEASEKQEDDEVIAPVSKVKKKVKGAPKRKKVTKKARKESKKKTGKKKKVARKVSKVSKKRAITKKSRKKVAGRKKAKKRGPQAEVIEVETPEEITLIEVLDSDENQIVPLTDVSDGLAID